MEKSNSRVKMQQQLLNEDLLVETAEALRSKADYDISSGIDLKLAVLCHALQESASNAVGTAINLHGVYRALNRLQALAVEAR